MRNLNALAIFRDVAKAGGYSAAERITGQSRATLSRNVIALEEELGVRLIERSKRSFRLTDPGVRLFERLSDALSQLDDAVAMVESGQAEPQGLVRIAAPPSLLHLGFGDAIRDFMQQAPKVRLQLEVSNREVDVRYEEVDFVLRARAMLDYPLDYVTVSLMRMDVVLVAHPRWKGQLRPRLEDTLLEVPALAWTGVSGRSHWRMVAADGTTRDIPLVPRLIVNDIATLHAALLDGMGLGVIPRTYVEEDIALGRLQLIETDLAPMVGIVHAVHLGRHGMRPAVRQLLDWLKRSAPPLRAR